ncbi:MAG: dihydroxy-acid dehydratase, partial [Actinomycetota bacterium]|nr:dihydroxy-acid dehydratase [Actinomycetota bacterium]
MADRSDSRWKRATIELRAAGFDPADVRSQNAIVTIAGAHTNAHRCNNRVERISDLLGEAVAARGGQGLVVGAPAVSDALTQGSVNASYSLVSRDLVADCFETGHRAHHAT